MLYTEETEKNYFSVSGVIKFFYILLGLIVLLCIGSGIMCFVRCGCCCKRHTEKKENPKMFVEMKEIPAEGSDTNEKKDKKHKHTNSVEDQLMDIPPPPPLIPLDPLPKQMREELSEGFPSRISQLNNPSNSIAQREFSSTDGSSSKARTGSQPIPAHLH